MKCLEKDRSRRYETANGLARDMERYLADELVEARPPSAGYRLRKFVRRNKGRVVAAGLFAGMLFLVIGLIVYGTWWADRQSAERRHEQALIAARNNDAINATLDRIEAALRSGGVAEAGTLLEQADQHIDEQTTADLRERHGRLKKDERTVRELNDIFEERWMVSPSDIRMNNERAKQRYPALFQNYDLAVGTEPAPQIVEKIHRSLIADALASGAAEWFFVDPKYPGLLAVADLLDPDPAHATLRAAIVNDEKDRVKEVGKTIDASRLSPAYAIGLGTHPAIEDGLPILKAAWTAHPDSFPLALTIGSQLFPDKDAVIEAVGWCQTAVALRPNNPLAHYYHAVALSWRRRGPDVANAVDELHRTIQLAPRFAKAYGRLAYVLYRIQRQGRGADQLAEAVDAARTAVELDQQNILGHYVLYSHLLYERKDYLEAARISRRLDKLFPTLTIGARDSERDETLAEWGAYGEVVGGFAGLLIGLIEAGRPFEAYRLVLDGHPPESIMLPAPGPPEASSYYLAACAAALAGTGQGLDAPPPGERPGPRKHALEWLNASLDAWKKEAAALPVPGASTAGLMGSPFGQGPLLAISALAAGSTNAPADNRGIIHEGMNHWLSDADLAGVRDDQWLAKLAAEEREQWRKLWREVQSLRDRTAPRKTMPPAGK